MCSAKVNHDCILRYCERFLEFKTLRWVSLRTVQASYQKVDARLSERACLRSRKPSLLRLRGVRRLPASSTTENELGCFWWACGVRGKRWVLAYIQLYDVLLVFHWKKPRPVVPCCTFGLTSLLVEIGTTLWLTADWKNAITSFRLHHLKIKGASLSYNKVRFRLEWNNIFIICLRQGIVLRS